MAEKQTVGVRLPVEIIEKIDDIAQKQGVTRSDVLMEAIFTYCGERYEAADRLYSSILERLEKLEKKQKSPPLPQTS